MYTVQETYNQRGRERIKCEASKDNCDLDALKNGRKTPTKSIEAPHAHASRVPKVGLAEVSIREAIHLALSSLTSPLATKRLIVYIPRVRRDREPIALLQPASRRCGRKTPRRQRNVAGR